MESGRTTRTSRKRLGSRILLPKHEDEVTPPCLSHDEQQSYLDQGSDSKHSSSGKRIAHTISARHHRHGSSRNHGSDQKNINVTSSTSARNDMSDYAKCGALKSIAQEPTRESRHENKGSDQVDNSTKRKRSSMAKDGKHKGKLLACPLNKYDNYLFGGDSPKAVYHQCGTCSFEKVAHLKQHLQRVHSSLFYCVFCSKHLSSQKTLDSHACARPTRKVIDPPLPIEQIDHNLARKLILVGKNDKGVDRVKYWFTIFDTLFPGVSGSQPINPFFEGPGPECLKRFLAFSTSQITSFIEDVLINSIANLELAASSQTSSYVEASLQQAAKSFSHHLSEIQWPQLGQRKEEHVKRSRDSDSILDQTLMYIDQSVLMSVPSSLSAFDFPELYEPIPSYDDQLFDFFDPAGHDGDQIRKEGGDGDGL